MAYNVFDRGLRLLTANGLVEMFIFALIFATVYGVLSAVHLFGTPTGDDEKKRKKKNLNRKLNSVIALVLAALSIIPHYVSNYSKYDIVRYIIEFLPNISIGVLLIFCVLLLLGMFGWNMNPSEGHPYVFYIFIIIIGYVLWVFGDITRIWNLPRWLSYDMVAVIVAVLVFVGIVKFIMGDDKPKINSKEVKAQIAAGDFKNIKAKDLLNNMFGGHK